MNSCALLLVKTTPIRLLVQTKPTVLALVSTPTALVQDPKPTVLANTTAPTLLAQVNGGPRGPIGPAGSGSDIFSAETDDTLTLGAPVYVKVSGNLGLAQADALPQTRVRGLSTENKTPGFAAITQTQGVMTQTTAAWDALTGDVGGLTNAAPYYVDPATPGKLTKTGPSAGSGEYCAFVGAAVSSTEMDIDIRTPIKRS